MSDSDVIITFLRSGGVGRGKGYTLVLGDEPDFTGPDPRSKVEVASLIALRWCSQPLFWWPDGSMRDTSVFSATITPMDAGRPVMTGQNYIGYLVFFINEPTYQVKRGLSHSRNLKLDATPQASPYSPSSNDQATSSSSVKSGGVYLIGWMLPGNFWASTEYKVSNPNSPSPPLQQLLSTSRATLIKPCHEVLDNMVSAELSGTMKSLPQSTKSTRPRRNQRMHQWTSIHAPPLPQTSIPSFLPMTPPRHRCQKLKKKPGEHERSSVASSCVALTLIPWTVGKSATKVAIVSAS